MINNWKYGKVDKFFFSSPFQAYLKEESTNSFALFWCRQILYCSFITQGSHQAAWLQWSWGNQKTQFLRCKLTLIINLWILGEVEKMIWINIYIGKIKIKKLSSIKNRLKILILLIFNINLYCLLNETPVLKWSSKLSNIEPY